MTLSPVSPYFIASVYDQDYLPYTTATVPASLTTAVAANGVNEATALNIQGTLSTTGVTIAIPYTVVTASVTIAAYSQTITVPASATQDGISRDVNFSYPSGTYAVGSGYVVATLKAVGSILNAKQLDVQSGIGNDNLGYLLGQFTYFINGSGGTANFQVRDIAGIPDRNSANANHVMLYLAVTGADGNVWLNNNLGADYSNTANVAFNPAQQAIGSADYHAYGSLFQWGRYSDGHELINWNSGSGGAAVNGVTSTLSSTDTPVNSLFITNSNDWLTTQNDALWQGESGANNPCPIGFRLPTNAEWTGLVSASNITNFVSAASSTLKLPAAGDRYLTSGSLINAGFNLLYWSSSVLNAKSYYLSGSNTISQSNISRTYGCSVRCIKN